MKNKPANRRAFAALIPATLLLATPAFAQEVQPAPAPPVQTVAPPPVVPTIAPPTATVAPPAATVTPPPAAAPAVTPTIAETPDAAAPVPRTATRTTRTVTRTARVTRAPAPAPVRAVPAPVAAAPVVAPVVTPVPVAPPPVEAAAPASVAPAPVEPETATQTSTVTESAPVWPWILGGLLLIGAIGFFVMRRRRTYEGEVRYDEPFVEAEVATAAPIRSEPVAFAPDPEPQFLRTAPLAAAVIVSDEPAPLAAEEATLAEPEAEEVSSLTEGDAPVADRPWLEFSLRPVRAGTNVDEALVEIELTVGNSGSVTARDVRISTFMFASGPASDSDMERMLLERGDDGVPAVTIEPGEGTRVDATLALSKAELIENTNGSILPIIVADARYTLPDGSEGHTSASFTIGVSEEGAPAMSPIQLNERAMHDDVEARLHGVPEHS